MFLPLAALTSIILLWKGLETSTCAGITAASKLECSMHPRAEFSWRVLAGEAPVG